MGAARWQSGLREGVVVDYSLWTREAGKMQVLEVLVEMQGARGTGGGREEKPADSDDE